MLDTSICIELARRRAAPVVARLRRRKVGTVGISSITLGELEYGVARSRDAARNRIALAHVCAPLVIVPFDDVAAASYGAVRAALEATGGPIGPLDTLIAAHALALRATLITNNEREFRRVTALKIENWLR